MFETITFDVILKRMLDRVSNEMDKREGSVIYDALAPAAVEFQNMLLYLDMILTETFADTASLPYLKRRAAERGIYQYPATNAIRKGVFTPASVEVPVGAVFSLEKINYTVVEKITAGEYKLKCDTPGSEGNGQYGSLIPVDYIAGLETAELTDLLVPGDDEEDVEALRERYFRSLTSQAYGGNIADYEEKCMSIPGVGDVKVAPVWNGGGTVKLTIIDSTFSVPSSTFVDEVQEIIDPEQNAGKGYGVAPIGHVVTVVGVKPKTVNIETTITYADGWSWEAAKTSIQEAVDGYFKEQAKAWKETKPNLIVRISQIESRILDCEGVLDISGTTLNGNASNLSLAVDEIPVRGTINGN